jgi:Bacterial Ig domain
MTNAEKPRKRERFSSVRVFAIVLGICAAIASAEFYALWQSRRVDAPPPVAEVAPKAPVEGPVGAVDTPADEAIVGPQVHVSGWALDPVGIARVEIRVDDQRFNATIGGARPDVAQIKTGFPQSDRAGFEFIGDLTAHPAAPGVDRRTLSVVAVAQDGRESVLGRKSLIDPTALTRWRDVAHGSSPSFYLLPALSGIKLGGAQQLDSQYSAYVSRTMHVGMRVPILYLRTTKGAAADYAFDPDWDIEHRCGERRIAEDSLATTLDHAKTKRLPVLITLNGGIWADAACDVPAWDINDKLEQDVANCQWNEKNQVMPDDARKDLPGSQHAPELGRSLTFNVYARDVRRYKKRNLQQAAQTIVTFMRQHLDLVVGVTLDPDTYLNPFFGEAQWYDYNPGTLKQFRHWLAGTGPYEGATEDGVPDLSAYRRRKPLTLADVSKLASREFRTWNDVDPPRIFSRDPAHPFWQDRWVREWETFRRHLVDLHYDELSQWLVEVGVPRDRIWSAQGFMAPAANAMPFALAIDSPVKNYDSGGMSVEGAKPEQGHLGAILYGASAVNDIPMENARSLFATLAAVDPGFAVVEFNTADLRAPDASPTYAAGYRALRDLWNAGARFVSPMAWNGSNGAEVGKPGYVTFTAWRNTPLEEAARDFLLARAGLPLGSLLWTFGTSRHADGDGWTAESGSIALAPGSLRLTTNAEGRVAIVSPRGLALTPERIGRIVAGLPHGAMVRSMSVYARGTGNSTWQPVGSARNGALMVSDAGRIVTSHASAATPADQLKIEIAFERPATDIPLTRIAVLRAR